MSNEETKQDDKKVSLEKPRRVEVDADKLEQFMTEFAEMKKEITRLGATADKGRLAHYDAINSPQTLTRIVRISRLNGKIVKEWGNLKKDEKIFNTSGQQVGETQIREIVFLDGSKSEMNYLDSLKMSQPLDAQILETRTGKNGVSYLVQVIGEVPETGQEFEIDAKFVNQ